MVEHSDEKLAHGWVETGPSLSRKVGAEMIGTFALVFCGCGAIVMSAMRRGALDTTGIGLVFGLVIMVMIYATGHISGAHFNPAVTIAFAVTKRFPWRQVPAYILGQIAAAILGAYVVSVLFVDHLQLAATRPSVDISDAFMIEVVITAFLMFVIKAVATDSRAVGQMAGLAIGGAVALGAMVTGPLTGASMNPARSIGPAMISGFHEHLWIYLIAPVVGACLGAIAYSAIRGDEACTPDDNAGGCC